jgi:hypothetical protein
MMSRKLWAVGCLLSLALMASACEQAAPEVMAQKDLPVIYGTDDRQDWYQITDPGRLGLASATAAVVDAVDVQDQGNGTFRLVTGPTLGVAHRLCTGEPYFNQPTAAFCSAFLVAPDLLATAGHCIDATTCSATAFVFGFQMTSATTATTLFPASDVYHCASVVSQVETNTNDYAVVRLDRAVSGRTPLALRRSGAVALGTPLVVAGHPSGIPLKVAGNAAVKDAAPAEYFQANLDTYGGNSGSAVVDAGTTLVEGILVRGNTDYVYKASKRCYVANVCPDTGCPNWEEVTRASMFFQYVPAEPDCTADPDCDDADPCNGSETCASGFCQAGQAVNCDDGSQCTADACVDNGGAADCAWTPVTCSDGNACTTDSCDPLTGCKYTAITCPAGQVCSNGVCVASCTAKGGYCAANATCCSKSCNLGKKTCR